MCWFHSFNRSTIHTRSLLQHTKLLISFSIPHAPLVLTHLHSPDSWPLSFISRPYVCCVCKGWTLHRFVPPFYLLAHILPFIILPKGATTLLPSTALSIISPSILPCFHKIVPRHLNSFSSSSLIPTKSSLQLSTLYSFTLYSLANY